MEPLTSKQQEILDFLKQEILRRGFPPSVREICQAVGLKSTSSVHSQLNKLEMKGYIRRDPDKPRAIEILDGFQDQRRTELAGMDNVIPESEIVNVPVVGNVAAGEPLLAVEQIENYFPIPVSLLPNAETFLLKVHGESMVNAGILDGDYVLVEKRPDAQNGQMVVALIEDSATVKTFYQEDGYVRLQPENDYMDPIIVRGELLILGKVIGVMRFL